MKPSRKFPSTRLRRNRQSANLRDLVAENALSSDDLIQPIFIKEGLKGKESIEPLPGVSRLGLDVLNEEIRELRIGWHQGNSPLPSYRFKQER